MINTVLHGDCLEVMKDIPDKSIDMILCDLPYGTTACKWDTIIPFEPLWEQYKRVIKDNGAIVLTASQPFTSALVMSNPKMFKYEWIWEKTTSTGFANAKKQPMRIYENISIFYKKQPTYNPQMKEGKPYTIKEGERFGSGILNGDKIRNPENRTNIASFFRASMDNKGTRYPTNIIKFKKDGRSHPTQKPVALFEYLIKTYTNEGDLVLDNCAGSGTTGVACKNTGRNYILIEKEQEYIEIIKKRLTLSQ